MTAFFQDFETFIKNKYANPDVHHYEITQSSERILESSDYNKIEVNLTVTVLICIKQRVRTKITNRKDQ